MTFGKKPFVLLWAVRVRCGYSFIVLLYFNKIVLPDVHSSPGSALVPSEESSQAGFEDSRALLVRDVQNWRSAEERGWWWQRHLFADVTWHPGR